MSNSSATASASMAAIGSLDVVWSSGVMGAPASDGGAGDCVDGFVGGFEHASALQRLQLRVGHAEQLGGDGAGVLAVAGRGIGWGGIEVRAAEARPLDEQRLPPRLQHDLDEVVRVQMRIGQEVEGGGDRGG